MNLLPSGRTLYGQYFERWSPNFIVTKVLQIDPEARITRIVVRENLATLTFGSRTTASLLLRELNGSMAGQGKWKLAVDDGDWTAALGI